MTIDFHTRTRDVQTTLNYYVSDDDQVVPYAYVEDPPAGTPKSNVQASAYPAVIHDARPSRDAFNLDLTGFQFVTSPSVEKTFDDEERVKREYYPEIEAILKAHVGAKRVFIFDHTIRRLKGEAAQGKAPIRTPVHRVHVDQTFEAAKQRVLYHLPEEAERLLQGRYRIINVWRPIANNVAHEPLGVADFRTINVDTDLVPTRLIYPHREGGTLSVKHNPSHTWYYLSDQTPDEVTLIKCFDSDIDKARLTPHSAFADKTSPKDAPMRQSIEVRALVFDRE